MRKLSALAMEPLNMLGMETAMGFRTAELRLGDITDTATDVDVLVVSAFAGSYHPTPGSVIGALSSNLGLSVAALEANPGLDLRGALGVWVSAPTGLPACSRILCVEMTGGGLSPNEAIENVFAGLFLLSAKGIPTRVVALPLLGSGYQRYEPDMMAEVIVSRAKQYLDVAPMTNRLLFVEKDADKARQLSEAIDRFLGRARVTLPQEQLVGALRQDVLNRLHHAQSLFAPDGSEVRDEWIRILHGPQVRSTEFGICSRKLVELLLTRLGAPPQHLYKRIRSVEEHGEVAPWICGYMHVLRHLGNESAHQRTGSGKQYPPVASSGDLTAGLFCVQRLLEFWIDHEHGWRG